MIADIRYDNRHDSGTGRTRLTALTVVALRKTKSNITIIFHVLSAEAPQDRGIKTTSLIET